MLSAAIVAGLEDVIQRHEFFNHPDAVVATRLLRVLRKVEDRSDEWAELAFKRYCARELEQAAVCLERDFHRSLGLDLGTEVWASAHFRAAAEAIRRLKRHFVFPEAGSSSYVQTQFATALLIILGGQWASLEAVDPETYFPRLDARRRGVGSEGLLKRVRP